MPHSKTLLNTFEQQTKELKCKCDYITKIVPNPWFDKNLKYNYKYEISYFRKQHHSNCSLHKRMDLFKRNLVYSVRITSLLSIGLHAYPMKINQNGINCYFWSENNTLINAPIKNTN